MQKNEKEKLLGAVRDQFLQNEMRIRIHGILGIFQKFLSERHEASRKDCRHMGGICLHVSLPLRKYHHVFLIEQVKCMPLTK